MPSDIGLLQIEIETLWVTDTRSRLVQERRSNGPAAPYLVIACSHDGRTVAIGSDVPDALAAELEAAVAAAPPSPDPATPAAPLARCALLLEDAFGAVDLSSGPSYLIEGAIAFESAAEVTRSDDANVEALRRQNPDRGGWSPEEWRLLLDGTLGSWALATTGGQVISICHTARLAGRGAEAGVWTDPDFRSQGHAAAVTAAWASLLAPSGRYLFYSTSANNSSSQRVAARLNLRPIGWMWKLSRPATT